MTIGSSQENCTQLTCKQLIKNTPTIQVLGNRSTLETCTATPTVSHTENTHAAAIQV